jgi:hypothetical protein
MDKNEQSLEMLSNLIIHSKYAKYLAEESRREI